jgi:hypothetical protein
MTDRCEELLQRSIRFSNLAVQLGAYIETGVSAHILGCMYVFIA